MAVETNARIEFSVAAVEEWEKVNPKLHQGEPVFAKKPSGKYILKVGAPGGSTYKNAVVVWDQDDAETKMTSTQEAAAQALASKNAASASASAAKASENAASTSKSAAEMSAENAKNSETNAAASKAAAANSASIASAKATASANSSIAAATSEKNAAVSASAAATSESNALKSASAAKTSAGNAKGSETNASASASAAKASENAASTSKSAAEMSAENAKNSETNAAASANTAKAWSMSDSSPDGVTGNKSAKTWAEAAKVLAGRATASASAAQSSAETSSYYAEQAKAYAEAPIGQAPQGSTSAKVWAATAGSEASSAASSASSAASSASDSATSATNAKTSETNAAKSASAAAQSAKNAKTWDPTNYTKTIMITKPHNNGHRVLTLLEEVTNYDDSNSHKCGGSFSIYPYVRYGGNPHLEYPPVYCAISFPYKHDTMYGYNNWSTNSLFIPVIVKNNTTNKVYWGISIGSFGLTFKMFGAFEHNISVIDTLLSQSDDDVYDGYTVLYRAEVITPAKASDIPTQYVQSVTESNGKVTVTQGNGKSTTFNAGLNILARNKAYAVGDIAYSPNLPSYLYLECTTAGTTGKTEPNMSPESGAIVKDGTSQFSLKTVCAKEYVDALRKSDEAVNVPITNRVGTDFINDIHCIKSGHVVYVQFEVLKVQDANEGTRDNALFTGLPHPAIMEEIWTLGHTMGNSRSSTSLRGFVKDDYFSWHYNPNWQHTRGDECVYSFCYLTND